MENVAANVSDNSVHASECGGYAHEYHGKLHPNDDGNNHNNNISNNNNNNWNNNNNRNNIDVDNDMKDVSLFVVDAEPTN